MSAPTGALGRRVLAEGLGTGLLVAIVVGAGIAAQRLSPGDTGLQLLESALATGAGLVALILAFGSVSGAHFNPVVSLADWLLGGLTGGATAAYLAAQVTGACAGCIVANLMFDLAPVTLSDTTRSSSGTWLGEVVATFGLLVVIFGLARSGRGALAPFAVAAYITAAYWFTSSTSFANPAVTIGRTLTDTFAGIAWSSVPAFIAFQLVGGALALVVSRALHPDLDPDDVVVPHAATGGTP
ncbi:MAG TPA: MIP/aquaporin family protein [Acidimicrobiales bacterium]|nr:MIP/aquaporin family protein [Acidimicrobiales bacterium]